MRRRKPPRAHPAETQRHRINLPGLVICVVISFVYIPLQTPVPPNSPVERLVRMLDWLCAAIAARRAGGVLTVPLFFLLWKRVRHTAVKAIKLAAGIAAGVPPPITRPRKTPRPPRPPILRLPRQFAWIVKVVPGTAAYGIQLQYLLAQPELAPLVADPRFRRMINPLCRMLAIPKLPPLPRRPVEPRPTTPEPAADPAAPEQAAPRPAPPEQSVPEPGIGSTPAGRDPPPIPVAA
jgi:hypothetical protein